MVPDGNALVFELLQCLQNPYVVPQTKTVILVLLRTAAAHPSACNERIIGDIGGIEVCGVVYHLFLHTQHSIGNFVWFTACTVPGWLRVTGNFQSIAIDAIVGVRGFWHSKS